MTTRTRTLPAPGWTGVSASVRGAQHVRTGLVNQDAVQISVVDVGFPLTVAAVADGHGGSRYVRSDVGAQFAVAVACRLGGAAGGALGPSPRDGALRSQLQQLVDSLVREWRIAVRDHVAQHPFTPAESETAGVQLEDADPLVAYGCTMLLGLLAPDWVAFVQIGDGDVVIVDRDGRVAAPVPGDDRLVGGETTSLCLPSAQDDARIALCASVPDIVLLATDGYGNSFASPDWMQETGSGFAEHVRTSGVDSIADRLPGWLAESAEAGGDDVTVALLFRDTAGPSALRPGAAVAGPAATQATVVGPSEAEPAPTPDPTLAAPVASSKGSHRGALVAALVIVAVVMLLAGGAAGWFAAGGKESTGTTVTASTATSSPTSVAPPAQAPETSAPVDTAPIVAAGATGTILAPPAQVAGVQVIQFDSITTSSTPPTRVARIDDSGLQPVTTLVAGGALWSVQDSTGRLRRQDTPGGGATNVRLDGRPVGGLAAVGDHVWVVTADGSAVAAVTFDGVLDGEWRPVVDAQDGEWLQPGGSSGN